MYWIIARSASGERVGAEFLATTIPPLEDRYSHGMALTREFQHLLKTCWPDCHWVMVDPHKYVVFRADTGVVGTLTLSTSAEDFAN